MFEVLHMGIVVLRLQLHHHPKLTRPLQKDCLWGHAFVLRVGLALAFLQAGRSGNSWVRFSSRSVP